MSKNDINLPSDSSETGKTEKKIPEYTYKEIFPYSKFRPNQEEVIAQVSEAIDAQKNVLLVASNGTGKTIMALSAILPVAQKKEKKILFVSRTYTQNGRVIEESREITKHISDKKLSFNVSGFSIRGRNEMCLHKTIKRLGLPPNDSMSVCSTLRKNKQCHFFDRMLKDKKKLEDLLKNLAQAPLDSQELLDLCDKLGYCPYFISKLLIKYVDIVVCNYQWIFHPDIRETFLESMGVEMDDCIVIMDECHNLPDMANEINSYHITPYGLRMALRDLEQFRANKNLLVFIRSIQDMLDSVRHQVDEEVPVDTSRFFKQILSKNNFGSMLDLKSLLEDLADYGTSMQDEKASTGSINRDYVGPIVEFFQKWQENMNNPAFFPCLTAAETKQGHSVSLELRCMDPRPITNPIFKETYATLCLSGTIHPFTFSTLLGLNETGKMLKIIKMKPPFPRENIHPIVLEQINTRGDNRTDNMYSELMPLIEEVVRWTPKNVGVFCASYDVLQGLWRNGFESMVTRTGKKCFREEPGMSAGDNDIVIEQYKEKSKSTGAVLLGVCGGRNSEGEDFPGDFMNSVIIVGVPFTRPTPSLNQKIEYYDKLFSCQGRMFAYTIPAFQRSNQACGRPVRRMDDRAFILLMDNRFLSYKEYLSDWVRQDLKSLPPDPFRLRSELQSFFPANSTPRAE